MTKMDQALLREKLWAKSDPFKPLWMHLLEAGIVAQQLVAEGCFHPLGLELCRYLALDEKKMLALVGYIAAVHDIGKAAGPFQDQYPPRWKDELKREGMTCDFPYFRHEDYGAYRLQKLWEKKARFSDLDLLDCLQAVIRYHHQGKQNRTSNAPKRPLSRRQKYFDVDCPVWLAEQEKLENSLWESFCPSDAMPNHLDAVCTLLLGIVIAADWIASGDTFASLEAKRLPKQTAEDARRIAHEFFASNYMLHRTFPSEVDSFSRLWPQIPAEGMRPLQRTVQEIFAENDEKPLAVIIEAPMGEGKTEAGLYAAARLAQRWDKEGFYVALPTAATSNQMYDRVNKMLDSLQRGKAKLMHGMAWLMDEEQTEQRFYGEAAKDAELWTAPMRRGMISPFAVGTVDQAMMAVMRTKYGVLRLAGLAQKVLIIDELHSYDAYMSEVIKTLLSWCRVLHVPVVMLSATLPSEKKKEFSDCYGGETKVFSEKAYPAITLLYENEPARTVPVSGTHQRMTLNLDRMPYLGKAEEIAALVRERMEATGGCFCVLVNTVKEAQATYRAIRRLMPEMGENLLLFHARFSAKQRDKIEKKCISLLGSDKSLRPERFILVATQVVEQSLDLDFDFMVSALCPMDLLLQRAGRLWRHRDTKRPAEIGAPRLLILMPEGDDFGVSGMVYPPILLMRTMQALDAREVIRLPEDISSLVEAVYADSPFLEKNFESWIAKKISDQSKRDEAKLYSLPKPEAEQFWLADDNSKMANMFFLDEDSVEGSAFMAIKTRLGEESVRLAILPNVLFIEVKAKEHIDRALAKKVMQYSVSVAKRKLEGLLAGVACEGGEAPIWGQGLLSNLWMLFGEGGVCRFENGDVIRMDDELGLLIKGEENEV